MSAIATISAIVILIILCTVCAGSSNKDGNKGGYTQTNDGIKIIDTNFSQKIECPHCCRMVPASSKFCPGCGYDFNKVVRCPNCGTPVISGYRYCANCGHEI